MYLSVRSILGSPFDAMRAPGSECRVGKVVLVNLFLCWLAGIAQQRGLSNFLCWLLKCKIFNGSVVLGGSDVKGGDKNILDKTIY